MSREDEKTHSTKNDSIPRTTRIMSQNKLLPIIRHTILRVVAHKMIGEELSLACAASKRSVYERTAYGAVQDGVEAVGPI